MKLEHLRYHPITLAGNGFVLHKRGRRRLSAASQAKESGMRFDFERVRILCIMWAGNGFVAGLGLAGWLCGLLRFPF